MSVELGLLVVAVLVLGHYLLSLLLIKLSLKVYSQPLVADIPSEGFDDYGLQRDDWEALGFRPYACFQIEVVPGKPGLFRVYEDATGKIKLATGHMKDYEHPMIELCTELASGFLINTNSHQTPSIYKSDGSVATQVYPGASPKTLMKHHQRMLDALTGRNQPKHPEKMTVALWREALDRELKSQSQFGLQQLSTDGKYFRPTLMGCLRYTSMLWGWNIPPIQWLVKKRMEGCQHPQELVTVYRPLFAALLLIHGSALLFALYYLVAL